MQGVVATKRERKVVLLHTGLSLQGRKLGFVTTKGTLVTSQRGRRRDQENKVGVLKSLRGSSLRSSVQNKEQEGS